MVEQSKVKGALTGLFIVCSGVAVAWGLPSDQLIPLNLASPHLTKTFVALVLASLAFAAIQLARPRSAAAPNSQSSTPAPKPFVLRRLPEILLLTALAYLAVDGTLAVQSTLESTRQAQKTSAQLDGLNQVERALSTDPSPDYTQIASQVKNLGLPLLADQIAQAGAKTQAITLIHQAKDQIVLPFITTVTEDQHARIQPVRLGIYGAIITLIALVATRYALSRNHLVERAQTEIKSAERRFGELVEHLPVGLFVYREGTCEFVNAAWKKQSFPDPDNPAQSQDPFQAIHPEDREKVTLTLAKSEGSGAPFEVRYRLRTPSGALRHLEMKGVAIPTEDGRPGHLLGFSLDVTDTVYARAALQDAYTIVEEKNRQLSSALSELEDSLAATVRSFVKAVEAKDPYTAGHSERVMMYSLWLGAEVGLGPYEMRILELGALVHDVGKIGVPDNVLTKPARLTDEEYEIVKMHPEWGQKIIEQIGLFHECVPIVRWHHERLDGSGYPDRKRAHELSILVRIVSIADTFDAMTSNRAYRSGMEVEKALGILQTCADKGELDAQLVTKFNQLIRQRGVIPQDQDGNLRESA